MIIVVHANDWRAIQCNPIAQQSAKIVAIRPTQRNTIARLVTQPSQSITLFLRNKSAVAFIEIFGRADTRDLKRLSPGSCREIFCGFDCLSFRFQSCSCGIELNQRFGQNPAVQLLWRCYSEYAQNRWGKIDIASWQIVDLTAAKIRTSCDQHIVHVESTERGVRPLPGCSLPIRVNHSSNTESVF